MKKLALVVPMIAALVGCKDPRSALDTVIKDKHFIPYKLPMASSRVGTVMRGNDNAMYVVARPERCFPDLPDANSLRWTQPTDLPNQYKKVEFKFDAAYNPVLNSGSPSVTLKANVSYVKTVELEFKGASIEFLEELNFATYFNNGMPEECRQALQRYPFIGQGLRIESMKFVFKDEFGANVDLSTKMNEIVDIAAGVHWRIENNYSLIIETPKYIGYRMAKLTSTGPFPELQYASSVSEDGSWVFQNVLQLRLERSQEDRPADFLE